MQVAFYNLTVPQGLPLFERILWNSSKHVPTSRIENLLFKKGNFFRSLDFLSKPDNPSALRVLASSTTPPVLGWSNETDVQTSLRVLFLDTINATGLSDVLRLQQEFNLDDNRPDYWVLQLRGVPIAVIEAKPPMLGNYRIDIASSAYRALKPNAFYQAAEHMLNLQECFGVCNVFGLVATYEQFCVCWFEETTAVAESQAPSSVDSSFVPDCCLDGVFPPGTAPRLPSTKDKVKVPFPFQSQVC